MVANKRQSYDVEIRLECGGKSSKNTLDLKNPYFRYTGQAVAAPPGSNTQSPAEQYWLNTGGQAVPQVGGKLIFTRFNLLCYLGLRLFDGVKLRIYWFASPLRK